MFYFNLQLRKSTVKDWILPEKESVSFKITDLDKGSFMLQGFELHNQFKKLMSVDMEAQHTENPKVRKPE